MVNHSFRLSSFDSLPDNLKKSDYVDMLLLLMGLKPCVRLGSNNDVIYKSMEKWCEANKYSYVVSSERLMYIAKLAFIAQVVRFIDDSTFNHSYFLGRLLGYPRCCCRKISSINENAIDKFEETLCMNEEFKDPFDIINPMGYTEGYSFIAHVPCCPTCQESLNIAKKVKRMICENRDRNCMNRWVDHWYRNDDNDKK